MYSEARKLRHDMKQCVASAIGLIDCEQYQSAKDFLNNMVEDKIDTFGYIKYSNNQILNYIINDKNSKCNKENIEFKCVVFGKLDYINDYDISILVGNLLDNAIEAAKKTNKSLITTKEDKAHHGLGIKSIHDIVAKYSGEIIYDEKDGMMNCNVLLLKK